jgi:hypothetical protein
MLKVYLAARYDRKEEMKAYREILQRDHNVKVTSNWLDEPTSPSSNMGEGTDIFYTMTACKDLMDVDAAHVVIFFSENPLQRWKRGGRHVEFGYALRADKTIWVVGPKENVFHYRPRVHHFETFEELVEKKLSRKK